eukprot:4398185-Prymnesium_polylepis.1
MAAAACAEAAGPRWPSKTAARTYERSAARGGASPAGGSARAGARAVKDVRTCVCQHARTARGGRGGRRREPQQRAARVEATA